MMRAREMGGRTQPAGGSILSVAAAGGAGGGGRRRSSHAVRRRRRAAVQQGRSSVAPFGGGGGPVNKQGLGALGERASFLADEMSSLIPLFKQRPVNPQKGSCAFRALRNSAMMAAGVVLSLCVGVLCAPLSFIVGHVFGPLLGVAFAAEHCVSKQPICAVVVLVAFQLFSHAMWPFIRVSPTTTALYFISSVLGVAAGLWTWVTRASLK
jgi:hypothetical protein